MLSSYIIYNSILIIACSFAYLAEHGNAKLSRLFSRPVVFLSQKIPFASRLGNERHFRLFCRLIVFLALWIPASLRYGILRDYFNYVYIFNNIDIYTGKLEIGWVLLNKAIRFVRLPSQWVFVFSSLLVYFPVCFFIKRKNFFYCILFYIIFGMYFSSFNIIRQMIAVSFLIGAVTALEFKKNMRFFIWIALASLFHQSALFVLPFFPLKYVKFKKNIIPILITIIGVFLLFKVDILEITFSIAEKLKSKYAAYRIAEYGIRRRELSTGLGVLVKMLPSLFIVFMLPRITKKYPRKAFTANLSIMFVFLSVLSAQYVVMGRVRDVFIFVPMLVTGFAIQAAGKKYKKIVAIVLISSSMLLFEKDLPRYYSIFQDPARSPNSLQVLTE